jgi:hypothetical protein
MTDMYYFPDFCVDIVEGLAGCCDNNVLAHIAVAV